MDQIEKGFHLLYEPPCIGRQARVHGVGDLVDVVADAPQFRQQLRRNWLAPDRLLIGLRRLYLVEMRAKPVETPVGQTGDEGA